MSKIPIMRFPFVALLISLATMLVVVGCGGTGEPAAEPVATAAVAATSPPAVVATAPPAGGRVRSYAAVVRRFGPRHKRDADC